MEHNLIIVLPSLLIGELVDVLKPTDMFQVSTCPERKGFAVVNAIRREGSWKEIIALLAEQKLIFPEIKIVEGDNLPFQQLEA